MSSSLDDLGGDGNGGALVTFDDGIDDASSNKASSSKAVAGTGEFGSSALAQIESADFNCIDFVNGLFPNEASLAGVEPLMNSVKMKIRRVDAEILEAVRCQSSSGSRAREDLGDAQRAIAELFAKVKEIKKKADASEVMVQEICRDIKKLDYAKRHLTEAIAALRNLAGLANAVDQLESMAARRAYREAASMLAAANGLAAHFAPFHGVAKVAELRARFATIRTMLQAAVLDDLSRADLALGDDSGKLSAQLRDACAVIEALEPAVREEAVRALCGKELASYAMIFGGSGGEASKLDRLERRYAWIRKTVAAKEESWAFLPPLWGALQSLSSGLCKVTRAAVAEMLEAQAGSPDVGALLAAMQRTLTFESELAAKFAAEAVASSAEDDSPAIDTPSRANAGPGSEIRRKYEAMRREREARDSTPADDAGATESRAASAALASQYVYKGAVSAAFDGYLKPYVDMEERELGAQIDKLLAEETWSAEDAGEAKVLASASQVFLAIKHRLKRCAGLTRGRTLLDLGRVFGRALSSYASRLAARLPRSPPVATGTGAAAAAAMAGSTEWHLKLAASEEPVLCLIINTADYCATTTPQLAATVAKMLDPALTGGAEVDLAAPEEEFASLVTRALGMLVTAVDTRLDAALAAMAKAPWGTLDQVGDQSEFVDVVAKVLAATVPSLGRALSPNYFRYFYDKLAASFVARYAATIFRCRRVGDVGAQQLLLDTLALKTLLLDVPTLGGAEAVPPAYAKAVARDMARAESLLKVILSPAESVADTFRALLGDAPPGDLGRILELKGLTRQEQQALVDEYAARTGSRMALPAAKSAFAVGSMGVHMSDLGKNLRVDMGALGLGRAVPRPALTPPPATGPGSDGEGVAERQRRVNAFGALFSAGASAKKAAGPPAEAGPAGALDNAIDAGIGGVRAGFAKIGNIFSATAKPS